jgi:hypothetical protein
MSVESKECVSGKGVRNVRSMKTFNNFKVITGNHRLNEYIVTNENGVVIKFDTNHKVFVLFVSGSVCWSHFWLYNMNEYCDDR